MSSFHDQDFSLVNEKDSLLLGNNYCLGLGIRFDVRQRVIEFYEFQITWNLNRIDE